MNPELKQVIINAYQNYEIKSDYNNSSYTIENQNAIIKFTVNYVQASETFHMNLSISDKSGKTIQTYYRHVSRSNIILNANGMKILGALSIDMLDILNVIRAKHNDQERALTANIRTISTALAYVRENFDISNKNTGR